MTFPRRDALAGGVSGALALLVAGPSQAAAPATGKNGGGALSAPTRHIDVGGARIAYRAVGSGAPILFLQRYRATMNDWDPAFVDAVAAGRQAILVDYPGTGESTGTTPNTMPGLAQAALAVADALGLRQPDVLGWSLGGMVAQHMALARPARIRRLVLAGTHPSGGEGTEYPRPKNMEVANKPGLLAPEDELFLSYTPTQTSQAAGRASNERLAAPRRARARSAVGPEAMKAEGDALLTFFSGKTSAYPRLGEIRNPAFVANGDRDDQLPTWSHTILLAQRLGNAQLTIYPDSGHGFLSQYPERFGRDVLQFLDA